MVDIDLDDIVFPDSDTDHVFDGLLEQSQVLEDTSNFVKKETRGRQSGAIVRPKMIDKNANRGLLHFYASEHDGKGVFVNLKYEEYSRMCNFESIWKEWKNAKKSGSFQKKNVCGCQAGTPPNDGTHFGGIICHAKDGSHKFMYQRIWCMKCVRTELARCQEMSLLQDSINDQMPALLEQYNSDHKGECGQKRKRCER